MQPLHSHSDSFFFNDTSSTDIYTLSLHDALPIAASHSGVLLKSFSRFTFAPRLSSSRTRSEEHTSELQSLRHLVCRLLLEKKNNLYSLDNKTTTTRFTQRLFTK